MTEFEVSLPGLKETKSELDGIYGKLVYCKSRLDFCSTQLNNCIESSSLPGIKKSIKNSSKSLENQILHLRKMSNGLKQIYLTYLNTETAITGAAPEASVNEKPMSFFEKLLAGEPISGAIASKDFGGAGSLFGIGASGIIGGSFLSGKVESESFFGIEYKDENIKKIGIFGSVTGSGSILEGHASGQYGVAGGNANVDLIGGEAKGEIGATLFSDGKLSPSLRAELEGKAHVLHGKADGQIGNDEFNGHGEAEGSVLGAEGTAKAGLGVITYKDEKGVEHTALGTEAEFKAEAYIAKGEISGGFNLFGVKFDVGAEGTYGSAVAKAGGKISTGGVEGSLGLGLGLGAGVKFSIDWSGFKLPW